MKLIELSKNGKKAGMYFAQVDDADYEWLNQWNWNVTTHEHTQYAERRENKKLIRMHRFILGINGRHKFVDHKDHNGLNNQRGNLREATMSENVINHARIMGISKYRGVIPKFNKKTKKQTGWYVQIHFGNKIISLHGFKEEQDAAICYDALAKKYHGEFAMLNFP